MSTPAVEAPLDLGRPIKGPSALGDDPRRFVTLTRALAVTDFKLRFFGSALGYLWQLMRPLMMFGVLFCVFEVFLKVGGGVRFFPVALLLGIVLYSFFAEATSQSVRSLVTRENLVRKVEFPRLAVPLASVLTAVFNLALNLIPVVVFLLAIGGRPLWTWLLFPLMLGALVFLATGCSMLLSALFVRYRDVEPIWDVITQALFYATPIFWPIARAREMAGGWVATLVMCNPFAVIVQQSRHWFIDPSHESAATAIGGWPYLLIPGAITLLVFAFGYRTFAKQAPRVAEDL
ncbi:MAG: transporter permease [Chthonomonadaceae bacterium]|nr:transporter permease [Chthonomonadaceae bacterium]